MPPFATILAEKIARLETLERRVPCDSAWQQISGAWRRAEIATQTTRWSKKTAPACFETLGVEQCSGPDDIKRAFRVLALQAHPDCGGDHMAFIALQHAYEQAMEHVAQRA